MIRKVKLEDADQIAEIYNYYILNSIATFEETPISGEDIKERINTITLKYPWIVYEDEGQVVGYAYAGEWRARNAYRFSVESSVYLKNGLEKKGIGSGLYQDLLNQLKEMNFHTVKGVLGLPNEPSIYLHEKFGFKKVAHFKDAGFKFGKWVDVGYWQLIID